MGVAHAVAGKAVKLLLSESELGQAKTTALVKTSNFETMRLCVHEGQEIPAHKTKGPITVQCLQGKVVFTVGEVNNEMTPGDWLYLEGDQLHSLKGVEDSALLLTIVFTQTTVD
ncbi:MAG: cupin domain-containing protein [Bdellovibrionales bacterium]|nr:cupin domain-containing protein [Bdellovibrionales bacterium]